MLGCDSWKSRTEEIPNIFAAYGDTAYEVDKLGYAVDLRQYLPRGAGRICEGYIEEGSCEIH